MSCPFPSDPGRLVPLLFDPSSNSYFTLQLFTPSHQPSYRLENAFEAIEPPPHEETDVFDVFEKPPTRESFPVSKPPHSPNSSNVTLIDLEDDAEFLAEIGVEDPGPSLDESTGHGESVQESPFAMVSGVRNSDIRPSISSAKIQERPPKKFYQINTNRTSTKDSKFHKAPKIPKSRGKKGVGSEEEFPRDALFTRRFQKRDMTFSPWGSSAEPSGTRPQILNLNSTSNRMSKSKEPSLTSISNRHREGKDKNGILENSTRVPTLTSTSDSRDIRFQSKHPQSSANFPPEFKYKLSQLQRFFDKKYPGNPVRYISYLQCIKNYHRGKDIPCQFPGCQFVIKNSAGKYFPIEEHLRNHFSHPLYFCGTCKRKVADPLRHLKARHSINDLRLQLEGRMINILKQCFPWIIKTLNLDPAK